MPLETPHKPIEMLLVEDSPPDVLMAKAAFETAKLLFDLYVVEDGEEALTFLRHEGPYANALRPHPARFEPPQEGRAGGAHGDQGR
jgi:hypothetical protein